MSILNAWIQADRAFVGVDTEAADPGGRFKPASKMTPIVHLNAILACRGDMLFFLLLSRVCQFEPNQFDELVDGMIDFAKATDAEISRFKQSHAFPLGAYSNPEIIAVGWSERRRCMVAVSCNKHGDNFVSQVAENGCCSIAPFDQDFPAPPKRYDPGEVARYVQVQTLIARKKAPDASVGGRFIVATVFRNGMSIAPLCDLPAR